MNKSMADTWERQTIDSPSRDLPLPEPRLMMVPPREGKIRRCARCGLAAHLDLLNEEAFIHHGAPGLECKDREACERRRRKNQRRETR